VTNEEEPRNREEPGGPEEGLSQDPHVERLRPDPSEPPTPVRVLQGLLGDSDREGYKRLYFSRELDYYAEFRRNDVVYSEPIAPEQPPFVGLDAKRVGIRRDATIEYTRVRAPRPVDEFDLDIRLGGAPGRAGALLLGTQATCQTVCEGTCHTCQTLCQDTCVTCETVCQATCQATCETRCGQATCQATCQTCHTQCLQDTCATCRTQCGQATCQATCGHQHTCFGDTCPATICNTCDPGCIPTEIQPCRTRFGHAC
jgi:hypothetical protein